jgi:hypothetical protein
VRIDQSRDQDVVSEVYALVAGELPLGFLCRQKPFYGAVAHRDGMMLEDRARRLDRYDPAGREEEPVPANGLS